MANRAPAAPPVVNKSLRPEGDIEAVFPHAPRSSPNRSLAHGLQRPQSPGGAAVSQRAKGKVSAMLRRSLVAHVAAHVDLTPGEANRMEQTLAAIPGNEVHTRFAMLEILHNQVEASPPPHEIVAVLRPAERVRLLHQLLAVPMDELDARLKGAESPVEALHRMRGSDAEGHDDGRGALPTLSLHDAHGHVGALRVRRMAGAARGACVPRWRVSKWIMMPWGALRVFRHVMDISGRRACCRVQLVV